MPVVRVVATSGINLYVNPLARRDGDLLRCVNCISDPYGAKSKRGGYNTFLGTPDISQVNTLFSWTKNDGTSLFVYRASGSALSYSLQGTGAWTLAGNGTIGASAHVGHAILNDTLVICDGVGSTRHTTNGTSFTNTTLAPVAVDVEMYQNRIYANGTASTLFYSTTNDATNWNTSGTSDSSSLNVPGEGKLLKLIKVSDKLNATKNSGLMFKWDGYSLIDASSYLGPSSPYSVDKVEGYAFWFNRLGHFGYGGAKPQLLSNAIQSQVYNSSGSAITGSTFDTISAGVHKYDYLASVGTTTDDITGETIGNAIVKYDYQKNEYLNWSFANNPTAYHSYKDANGVQQLIFGDANGQCYQYSGTATTDNGSAIESVMEFMIDDGKPELEKEFEWIDVFFNPGNECRVSVAVGDTFSKASKKWVDVGDCSSGHAEFRFSADTSRGRILFIRISEVSKNSKFVFYGMVITYREVKR